MIGLTEECKQTAAADYQKGYFYVHLISIAITNMSWSNGEILAKLFFCWIAFSSINEYFFCVQMGTK